VPRTARGILREIRLIRLILLGRFRGAGALRRFVAVPPFPSPLPGNRGGRGGEGRVGNRAEPGAVPYLEDSRRRRRRQRQGSAVSSPGNLIPKRRVVFALPPEISTALWFPERGEPTLPAPAFNARDISAQVGREGRPKPEGRASPGGTVSLSRLFVRVYSTTMRGAQVRAPFSLPPPSLSLSRSLPVLALASLASRADSEPTPTAARSP